MTQTFGIIRRAIPPRVITSFSRGGAAPAGGTGAALLVVGETSALAIDFTLEPFDMYIIDAGTSANNFQGDPQSKLTVARSGTVATEFNSSGNMVTSSANTLRKARDIGTGTLRGCLIEPQRQNIILWNRDMTQSSKWTATNMTTALNLIGIDGASNSASTITASAANATLLQSVTIASASRVQTVYAKRVTGSGTLEMTMDNGTTWVVITPSGSSWERKSIPLQTVTNPIMGFRIATNGDAFGIDCVQNEGAASNTGYTSPIANTTVAQTRNRDDITIGTSLFPFSATAGSFKAKGILCSASATQALMSISDGGSSNLMRIGVTSSNNPSALVLSGGVTRADIAALGSITFEASNTIAMRFADNDYQAVLNGTLGTADTAGLLPTTTMTALAIGIANAASANTSMVGRALEKCIYLPRAMTNSELQVAI